MKQETNHTPGPWEVWEFDGSQQYASIEAGDGIHDLLRICDIPLWPCATEEMEANARLIAAAPELLHALEMVRDTDNARKLDGLPTIPPIARHTIDMAIAKAYERGEA